MLKVGKKALYIIHKIIVQNVVFFTVNFLNRDFTVLSVALLERCLIGGGARGSGMAWGGAVLDLIATKFSVHKTTHYYMHTF